MEIRVYEQSDHEAVSALHHAGLEEEAVNRGLGPWADDLKYGFQEVRREDNGRVTNVYYELTSNGISITTQ